MVGPWVHSGRRRSVVFLQRIRSHHPVKKRVESPSTKTDIANSMDRFNDPLAPSKISSSASAWRSQTFDGLEDFWGLNLSNEQYGNGGSVEPLVIKNPVHSRKLEEPIERKREYWSENLLYILRRENLIPKDRPVVMDRPTPEEPYRLSANVVRLLEQEPHLYIAKSNIKLSSFDSEASCGNSYGNSHGTLHEALSSSAESWSRTPFPHSRAQNEDLVRQDSLGSFDNRPPSRPCRECGHAPSSPTAGDHARKTQSFSSLSEYSSRVSANGLSVRHYSTTAARKPATKSQPSRV